MSRVIPDVIAVFEVVSPSSVTDDHDTKRHEYRAVHSIRHYLVIEQDRVEVTVLTRTDGTSDWQETTLDKLTDTVNLAGLPLSLPLREVYYDVTSG